MESFVSPCVILSFSVWSLKEEEKDLSQAGAKSSDKNNIAMRHVKFYITPTWLDFVPHQFLQDLVDGIVNCGSVHLEQFFHHSCAFCRQTEVMLASRISRLVHSSILGTVLTRLKKKL